jgi:hypothetical protein
MGEKLKLFIFTLYRLTIINNTTPSHYTRGQWYFGHQPTKNEVSINPGKWGFSSSGI